MKNKIVFGYLGCYMMVFCASFVNATPLDDYVWKPDKHYKYDIVSNWSDRAPGVTSYLLNMTSQQWLTEEDVMPSVWWHHLIINIPDKFDPMLTTSGYMFINGGHNGNDLPSTIDDDVTYMKMVAASSGSVTAVLKQVPNQPTVFKKDPLQQKRTEDAIIAYTWRHFIDDPSKPEWLARMPMTKSAVRGMDTITDFVKKMTNHTIVNFCVGGESKRGWTTWMTGAVDYNRTKCITPIVLDELNMIKNLHHHYRAYGGWTFEMDDYYIQNITKSLDDPNTQAMADIVDPYSYRDRLTMPKLMFCTGGDEFFLPDDSHYFFKDMMQPMYMNVFPNEEHSCEGHDRQLATGIQAFYVSVMKGFKLPKASWQLMSTSKGGSINVTMDTVPSIIEAWQATTMSKVRRDFRLYILGPDNQPMFQPVMWRSLDVHRANDYQYSAEVTAPSDGTWTAFFIKMTFPTPNGTLLDITTEVNIVPDTFPFKDCTGENCFGTLV